jgi:thioredoxin reductase (NADPH)
MENVEIIWDSQVAEICGNELVESIKIVNKKTGENTELEINGIFIAVGITPNTELVKNLVEVDENGYIVADETCETTQKGIFAAGDIRRKPMRQIITAVADGANAVNSVQKFLNC